MQAVQCSSRFDPKHFSGMSELFKNCLRTIEGVSSAAKSTATAKRQQLIICWIDLCRQIALMCPNGFQWISTLFSNQPLPDHGPLQCNSLFQFVDAFRRRLQLPTLLCC